MAAQEISARLPKLDKSFTMQYDFGDTLAQATEKFGEDVVFNGFKADAVVTLQGAIRRFLEKGQDPSILANTWVPGTRVAVKTDPMTAARNAFKLMTDEEKQALLADLMG